MKVMKSTVNVKNAGHGTTSKTKKKTKTQLIKYLDKLWSRYVRSNYNACIICGSNHHLNSHHIFSRRYFSTRFDPDNGVSLCYPHHIHLAHSKFEEFRDKILEIFGEEKYNDLKQKSQQIKKWTVDELIELTKELEEKIRAKD